MNKSSDLVISFFAAIFLHVGVAASFGVFSQMQGEELIPIFETGVSSVEISFFTPPSPPKPEEEETDFDPVAEPEKLIEEEAPPVIKDDGVQMDGQMTSSIRPKYPMGARIRGEEGIVGVSVTTDGSGRVTEAVIVETSHFSSLDLAALNSIKRAVFKSSVTGKPTAGTTVIRIKFDLID